MIEKYTPNTTQAKLPSREQFIDNGTATFEVNGQNMVISCPDCAGAGPGQPGVLYFTNPQEPRTTCAPNISNDKLVKELNRQVRGFMVSLTMRSDGEWAVNFPAPCRNYPPQAIEKLGKLFDAAAALVTQAQTGRPPQQQTYLF